MKRVKINTEKPYDVVIGAGLLSGAGEMFTEISNAKKIMIITDSKVNLLYADKLQGSLENSGFEVHKFVFPRGEKSKNINTLSEILEFLAQNKFTRTDIVAALGGGVTGDIAGFAAAIFLRGISFVQIPTTLLACVDSSVGGKTAVNLNAGKNLAGAFHQPDLVICDTDTLNTLEDKIFEDGMAEVIKYGMIFDSDFLNFLFVNDAKQHTDEIIRKCVEMKRSVVVGDEKDVGKRQLLNFGHTFAHALERLSNYKISHGCAVAIGMMVAVKGAFKTGITEKNYENELERVLAKYSLPLKCPFTALDMLGVMLNDKKFACGKINLVVPKELGVCELYSCDADELKRFTQLGVQ